MPVPPVRIAQIRNVHAPFSAAIDGVETFFKRRETLRVGPLNFMHFAVAARAIQIPDSTDTTRLHEALSIQWSPLIRGLLPDFRGLLTVRPNGTSTEVRLEGSYQPPMGRFGQAFDAIVGKWIAVATFRRLLNDIYEFFESGSSRG